MRLQKRGSACDEDGIAGGYWCQLTADSAAIIGIKCLEIPTILKRVRVFPLYSQMYLDLALDELLVMIIWLSLLMKTTLGWVCVSHYNAGYAEHGD